MSADMPRVGLRTREFSERIYPVAGAAVIVVTATTWFSGNLPNTEADSATLWGMMAYQSAAGIAGVAMVLTGLACLTFAAHRSAIAVVLLSALSLIGISTSMSIAASQRYSFSDGLWLGLVFCVAIIALTVLPRLEIVRPGDR